jgi:pimeloyl-ACP methyl ester carboxylesterase
MTDAIPVCSGAVPPSRSYDFDSNGFRLRVHEWGDRSAPPIVLCHGMWDHARGFDLLAPRLAERRRVLALDARGHGDSDWADAYNWLPMVLDVVRFLRSLGQPVDLLGHSKGGSQVTDAAVVAPELVRRLINIDGFGPPKEGFSRPGDDPQAVTETAKLRGFLDASRRTAARPDWPPYRSLEDLVTRRSKMNPRLSREWLSYFVWHGARRGADGFRWKVDPLAGLGVGPFKADWIAPGWRGLRAPMLAIVGREPDTWGPLPEAVLVERLAFIREVERVAVEDAGHFPHMERPAEVARLVLDFIA